MNIEQFMSSPFIIPEELRCIEPIPMSEAESRAWREGWAMLFDFTTLSFCLPKAIIEGIKEEQLPKPDVVVEHAK
jgi:hypothetical protein